GYWAAFALGGGGSNASLQIGGGGQGIYINGGLHSNDTLQITTADKIELDEGQITWSKEGWSCPTGPNSGCNDSDPQAEYRAPVSLQLPQYEEYEELAQTVGQTISGNHTCNGGTLGSTTQPIIYITGNLTLQDCQVYGLIVVVGEVTMKGGVNGEYSIIANGDIKVTGTNGTTAPNKPYTNPAYELLDDNVARLLSGEGDIGISGSGNKLAGGIIAENGELSLSGSDNRIEGALIAESLSLIGAGNQIFYEEEYFPPQPDFIELMQ
ncbi:MAG: hypothetical protein H0T73_10275, partial [Ardenticatenales bacterium]|nr:hypothetical protein [Ardenticatenales bacterium]